MKKTLHLTFIAILMSLIGMAQASDQGVEQKLRQSLTGLLNVSPDSINPAPIPGLYEVVFGQRIVYVSADGRFLLKGDIVDLDQRVEVTESRREELKMTALQQLDEGDMIVYGDADLPYTVTVFTDIDCTYCRKLHREMAAYNKQGIRIRYLSYPRAGLNSASARSANAVWCAEDRHKAMDDAKSGQSVAASSCESPVAEQYQLGQDFGISGTPALLLDNGQIIPGYVPANKLVALLNKTLAPQR